jgi:type I restriction enzyme R subunit
MSQINDLLDASIEADGFRIPMVRERPGPPYGVIDISAIDFAALAKRFEKTQRKNVEIERLKLAVRAQLEKMVQANPTRVDYLAKFEELIETYNNGSRNIDDLFRELIALTQALTDEQQRHVREQLSEEELTVFDLLTRPGPDLTPEEREEVKKVARHILDRVRQALVLNWRQKAQARARVKLVIEDTLDEGLPRAYTPELYTSKCSRLFEHVYERFA